jgi:flagellar hook assembly protein FlgD
MTLASSGYFDTLQFSLPINTGIEETNDQNTTLNEPLIIHPNPGRGTISISLTNTLETQHEGFISIYDVSGHLVRQYTSLSSGQVLTWSGDDNHGRRLPEGVYFVKYTAGGIGRTYKVVLLE